MFFIAYTSKGQVHVFAGRVKIVSHSSCRTSTILKYFCHLPDHTYLLFLTVELSVFCLIHIGEFKVQNFHNPELNSN